MADASTTDGANTRVRFAPSPTGYLHVGGARTFLFNWLVARQNRGTMVLRIEDTDRARHVEDSMQKILEDLRWLGLDWDEGPQVGGDYGPYFQSRRLEIYNRYVQQLLEAGNAYYALESPQEIEGMRARAREEKRLVNYTRPDPVPTLEQGLAARDEGKPVVVRFKMPDEDITVVDRILGDVTLAADRLEDFVILKADRFPTYHLACVVDDALMKITDVLRGQEHLMNTPKHIALQRALGVPTPRYGHLPVIFNADGTKMSKRDKEKARAKGLPPPEIDVHDFRAAGYVPVALLNFLSLLGWSPGDDRERFDLKEMAALFSVERIGKTNARFDRDKLLAFNTEWAARLSPERLLDAFKQYVVADPSVPDGMRKANDECLNDVLRVCAGFRTFVDVVKKAGFVFVPDDTVTYDPQAVKKVLAKGDGAGYAMLEALLPRLAALSDWSAAALESWFAETCEELGTGLGRVAQPVRVAISGTTVSPAIHETLSLLGKQRTVARITRCLAQRA